MAGEQTPISKVVSSGLETNMDEGGGYSATIPMSSPVINLEAVEISGNKSVSGENPQNQNIGDGSQLPPKEGHGSSLGSGGANVGSLFSTPSSSVPSLVSLFSKPSSTISPIITFSSPIATSFSLGQTSSQRGILSSLLPYPQLTGLQATMPGQSMAVGQSSSQTMPSSSSQSVTIQESHLLELIKLATQATQPPPTTPPPTQVDWFSQLTAALKPTPPTPPPPPPTGMEAIMKLLVEELKKQKPSEPVSEPVSPAKELLKILKIAAGEEADEQARVAKVPKSATKSRFCDWVANYTFPDGQKVPLIVGTYDGTRDPEDHLAVYDQAVLTEKWVDPVACHLFPGTLQGYALEWFTKLPEKSIKDYEDLKEKFVAQFAQQKKHRRSHLEAHLIRQREDESLSDFIQRYTLECQKIPGLPESQQISGFTLALLPGTLQDDLSAKIPSTFKDAIDIAYNFIRSKETASLVRGVTKKDKSGGGSPSEEGGRHGNRGDERRGERQEKRYGPYNKDPPAVNLIKSPREILNTERVCATFKPPSPMAFKSGRKNMDQYCEFHEDHGHDTNACRQLKLEIKRALDEGKLEHLVPGAKQVKRDPTKRTFAWQRKVAEEEDDDPGEPEGHVYMVHG